MKTKFSQKILSVFLCIALIMTCLPLSIMTAGDETNNRVVDAETLDLYNDLFYNGTKPTDTYSAGAVWTDKSVVTDPSAIHADVTMRDTKNNFLVALSAIASNKEIVGYSAIPTDTIFILDASSSMSATDIENVTNATNYAIQQLNAVSNHNRIGVVVYNGNAQMLLELDRYSATKTDYLVYEYKSKEEEGNRWDRDEDEDEDDDKLPSINVAEGVLNSEDETVTGTVFRDSGTYTQGGVYLAMQKFLEADTTVESGQIQGGTKRMPIFVLMTDGDPSYSASNYTAATNENRNSSISTNNLTTFYTMLTAAYAKSMVSTYYGRSALFYTLGYGISSSSNHAPNVLDTKNMTEPFKSYAAAYEDAGDEVSVEVEGTGIRKVEEITTLDYVTQYFNSSATSLKDTFEDIVEEIIIQSRYYATHVNGVDPDFDGYLTFEDKLGEYMEVKALDGIVHGNDYFTGAALAKRINKTDLGTIENPTEFGVAFRDSVKERLGIKDNAASFELVTSAYEAGQLSYTSDTEFSNRIGWYQKADGSYAGFYNEGTTTAPEGAVYKNMSYGFLGTVNKGTTEETDMMFMAVMVRTEIATGEQTVMWRIPATLMPMVTYKVTLDGTDIHKADMESLVVERNTPVRLVYEVGLNTNVINKYNVAEVMAADTDSAKHVNGDNYVFWSNYFDKSAAEHEDHIATFSHFTPNKLNERYYYTEDTAIYIKDGSEYTLVTDKNHEFDTTKNDYYHLRYYFTQGQKEITRTYDLISDISIAEEYRKYDNGQWFIKQGTVYRLIYPTAIVPKTENTTDSIIFSHKPFITIESGTPTATVKLGNNGRLSLTPETGIRVSKVMEEGIITNETFTFEVVLSSAATASSYPYMLSDLDAINGTEGTLTKQSGNKLTFELKAGQTMWITGLPAGTTYTVNEIIDGYTYAVKEVTVNGALEEGISATGTVAEYKIDDIDFVNGFADKGVLSVTKTVNHPYGQAYTIPSNISFTAVVKLTNSGAALANYEFDMTAANGTKTSRTTNAQGEITVTLKDGESVMLSNLPENTTYTVTEQNIPDGFTQTTAASSLTGTISTTPSVANLVNVYEADPVSPDADLILRKHLDGRDWLTGETFKFTLVRFAPGDVNGSVVREISATKQDTDVKLDLSFESYPTPGRYRYLLTENVATDENGITYDTVERQFTVNVADTDMDGKLEITSVENVMNTDVTGSLANGYTVTANQFNNSYAAVESTLVQFDVQKLMDTAGGTHALNGFKFGLYNNDKLAVESTVTDNTGKASFSIQYPSSTAGQTFTYKLKEINNGVPGITYDDTVYDVTVTIIDNYDGTTDSKVEISLDGTKYTDTVKFTNLYTPEAGKLYLDALKILEGRELKEGEFVFKLLDENRDELQEVKNAADGTITFEAITVDDEKTYIFYIVEEKNGVAGVIYSEEEYKVVASVVQNGSQYIEDSTVYYNKAGDVVSGADFTNHYKPAETDYTITATKLLENRELRETDDFKFELKDADGKLLQSVENVGEVITFESITYDKAGIYEYYISEVSGSVPGVTYDDKEYKVEIVVNDDGAGELYAEMTVVSQERAVGSIVFENTYLAAPDTDTIEGLKVLENKKLTEGEFEFELISVSTGRVVDTVTNDADGDFSFELKFENAGTYHYEVKEVNTHHSHISYDNTVYAIGYEVTDDGNGQLKAARTIMVDNTPVDEIVFTNVNNPENINVTVNVKKLLENKTNETMGLDGFKFKLIGDNIEEQILVTDADGNANFVLEYTLADKDKTYNYKLTEINTAIEGMVYDESEATASVKITLGENGELGAEVMQNGEAVEAITASFNNVYNGKPEPTPTPTPEPDPEPEPEPEYPESPKTGDTTNLHLWFALLFVSGGGIIGTTLYGKKRKTEEN